MQYTGHKPAAWMSTVLRLAGLCGIAAAAVAVLNPPFVLPLPVYSLGIAAAIMGLGFLLVCSDPYRHWPVVLMGLLEKVATGSWLAWDISAGRLSEHVWWWITVTDAIWLAPLVLILHGAHEAVLTRRRILSPEVLRIALRKKTQYGVSLDEISRLSPVLVVLLRHAGCLFCREALADLQIRRREIEGEDTQLVLVHMGSEEDAGEFFARFGLADVPRISDPERSLYRAFGLGRGALSAVFGPRVWWRGFEAVILGGHRIGRLTGDGFQMPGAFLVFHGEVVRSYRHQSAADRPDYLSLVTGRNYAAPELSDR